MRKLKRPLVLALLIVACARMAPPPGGPPRLVAPKLLSTFPDSGIAPCDFRGVAEFRFDEVTDEGTTANFGLGTGTLEQLVVLSPDTAVPTVEWHRNRITVRPRGGWRPNRTYRIELLAGVRDLRQNIIKAAHTIAFTTCGPRPTRVLSGRVADWMSARPAASALIEAFHLPDSARYRTVSDSTGRFRLTELPDGPYLVVATIDVNRDHKRNPGEAWDSVRVGAARDTVGEIWTFPRDTLPPRITDVSRQDSQSILVTFAKPIDPRLRIDSTAVRVRLLIDKDSTSIGTVYALPKTAYDSVQKSLIVRTAKEESLARADSVRKDSAARAAPPPIATNVRPAPPIDSLKQKRPTLGNILVIRTFGRVQSGKRYAINIAGVRLADGRTGPPVFRILTTPNPPSAADSAKARADSAKAKVRADSIAKADSIRKATKPDSVNLFRRR
jgi:hypothetical protein